MEPRRLFGGERCYESEERRRCCITIVVRKEAPAVGALLAAGPGTKCLLRCAGGDLLAKIARGSYVVLVVTCRSVDALLVAQPLASAVARTCPLLRAAD